MKTGFYLSIYFQHLLFNIRFKIRSERGGFSPARWQRLRGGLCSSSFTSKCRLQFLNVTLTSQTRAGPGLAPD